MKGENHGVPFSRCNLCTEPTEFGEPYCNNCLESAYKRCSRAVDDIGMEFTDLDITYRQMAKVLSDRGYW
jgi:hypothetical protein